MSDIVLYQFQRNSQCNAAFPICVQLYTNEVSDKVTTENHCQ